MFVENGYFALRTNICFGNLNINTNNNDTFVKIWPMV